MDRGDFMLTVLCSGGEQAIFTPVQVQKLFFLIDREVGAQVGGPYFSFQPYDYGPFDRAVYQELEMLSLLGLVQVDTSRSPKRYALTNKGFEQGNLLLRSFAPNVRDYLSRLATWVRTLSFAELVTAVYHKYPDMKVNSLFQ